MSELASEGELARAWQGALVAEQQAVFGYGLLGPYLPTRAEITLAEACQNEHQTLCETIPAAMVAAGTQPGDPAADYPDLYPVSVGAVALRLAVRLEDDAATAWRYLYAAATATRGASAAALRGTAQTELTACAVRAVRWRRRVSPAAATVAFPGI